MWLDPPEGVVLDPPTQKVIMPVRASNWFVLVVAEAKIDDVVNWRVSSLYPPLMYSSRHGVYLPMILVIRAVSFFLSGVDPRELAHVHGHWHSGWKYVSMTFLSCARGGLVIAEPERSHRATGC